MQTVFNAQHGKIIKALGRQFIYCEKSADAVVQAEWANEILSEPSRIFRNGRDSHDVASEVLDKAEYELIEFQLFYAN